MKNILFRLMPGIVLGTTLIAIYKILDNLPTFFGAASKLFSLTVPTIIAIGIAFVLYPFCAKIENAILKFPLEPLRKKARPISVITAYVAISTAILFVLILPAEALATSVAEILTKVPSLLQRIANTFERRANITLDTEKIYSYIAQTADKSRLFNINMYTSKIANFSAIAVKFVLIFITSAYILTDRDSLRAIGASVVRKIPTSEKLIIFKKYALTAAQFIRKYFYCVLADCMVVFVLSLSILVILQVPHALILSLVLGVFNLVPYFGSSTATIISVIVTAAECGLSKALWVGGALLILGQIDGNFIGPRIVSKSLRVKPFWVITGVFIGGGLFGIWGVILAVPIMATLKQLIQKQP